MGVQRQVGVSVMALLVATTVGVRTRAADLPSPTDPLAVYPEASQAIKLIKIPKDLQISVWATEPLLANPVGFTFDDKGRAYIAETFRYTAGTLDNRTRAKWPSEAFKKTATPERLAKIEDELLDKELASRTVEDRAAMITTYVDMAPMVAHSERVTVVEDSDGDGRADRTKIFANGFNTMLDGIGSSVLVRGGNVFFTNIPDLWSLKDTNGDGVADVRTSLSHGYGVRYAFGGHDLHGLRMGPDGRLYFSLGDRGASIPTKGGRIDVPESGGVFRCNLDGSELELFATGLRNPQDLVFDEHGNLFTGDNNSDGGDRARWVYVVSGGDSGWRIGYQSIETPVSRGPWNAEKMWQKASKDQPAYIVPPIDNLGNGPSGVAYYPGTGLSSAYDGRFFMVDFRGQSSSSGVHSFNLRPVGAGFELVNAQQAIWGVLATDIEWGVDGGLYVLDWVQGWPLPGRGRIYRIFNPATAKDPVVLQTRRLIAEGMSRRSEPELVSLLAHPDYRIRLEAELQLVERRASAALLEVARRSGAVGPAALGRLHALWGLGQLVRRKTATADVVPALVALVDDQDPEVRAQALNVMGDAKVARGHDAFIRMLSHPDPRTRFFAAQGLAHEGRGADIPALLELLRRNADTDAYIRHAAVMALVGIGEVEPLAAAAKDPSPWARLGCVVALRRLRRPEVARFLGDADARVVREVAEAVNDLPIASAIPQLAALAVPTADRPISTRIINANFREGSSASATRLAVLAGRADASVDARTLALDTLAVWPTPSGRDRVTNLWRPLADARDGKIPSGAAEIVLPAILKSAPDPVRIAAVNAIARLNLGGLAARVLPLVTTKRATAKLRLAALETLGALEARELPGAIKQAFRDTDETVRLAALRLDLRTNPSGAKATLMHINARGSIHERQVALASLAKVPPAVSADVLSRWMDDLLAHKVPPELTLDLLEAAFRHAPVALKDKLAKYDERRAKDDLGPYQEVLVGGDAELGKRVFQHRADVACQRCHKIRGAGGDAGPDLTGIGAKRDRAYLLESIALPNNRFAEGFESVIFTMKDGSIHAGIVKNQQGDQLQILTPEAKTESLVTADIKNRERGASGMPDGFAQILPKRDLRDLIEFLASQR